VQSFKLSTLDVSQTIKVAGKGQGHSVKRRLRSHRQIIALFLGNWSRWILWRCQNFDQFQFVCICSTRLAQNTFWKRFKIEGKLLLLTHRKSHTGFLHRVSEKKHSLILSAISWGIVALHLLVFNLLRYCRCSFILVERCSASHPGCETIWNTNVTQLYSDLIAGTMSTDRLQPLCRFRFLCYQQSSVRWAFFSTLK